MENPRDRSNEPAALGGETAVLPNADVPAAEEPRASSDESHRGFAKAHKQMREMQKSAAENWDPDAEQSGQPQSVHQ